MDDSLLAALGAAAPALERVSLAHCAAITDEGVCALAQQCPRLLELCLDDCPKVGRAGRRAAGSTSQPNETRRAHLTPPHPLPPLRRSPRSAFAAWRATASRCALSASTAAQRWTTQRWGSWRRTARSPAWLWAASRRCMWVWAGEARPRRHHAACCRSPPTHPGAPLLMRAAHRGVPGAAGSVLPRAGGGGCVLVPLNPLPGAGPPGGRLPPPARAGAVGVHPGGRRVPVRPRQQPAEGGGAGRPAAARAQVLTRLLCAAILALAVLQTPHACSGPLVRCVAFIMLQFNPQRSSQSIAAAAVRVEVAVQGGKAHKGVVQRLGCV